MFDLYVYPLGYKQGKEYSNLPGYFVGTAHRRAVRTREADIIVMRFTPFKVIDDNEADFLETLLPLTAQIYFKTKGPITTATRKTSEFFNERLIKYNQAKKTGSYLGGTFQLMVLHSDEVYFAHAGLSSAFVLSKSKLDLFQNRSSGNQGLGISKGINLKYFHSQISNGDRVVLSASPPEEWNPQTLSGSSRLSISHLRRVLIQQTDQDFEAVVIQFRKGTGSVHQLRLEPTYITKDIESTDDQFTVDEEMEEAVNEVDSQVSIPSEIPLPSFLNKSEKEFDEISHSDSGERVILSNEEFSIPNPTGENQGEFKQRQKEGIKLPPFLTKVSESTAQVNLTPTKLSESDGIYLSGKHLEKDQNTYPDDGKKESVLNLEVVVKGLSSLRNFLSKSTNVSKKVSDSLERGTASILTKANPSATRDNGSLSPLNMLFIAILIPLIVVAIATTVYFKSGRGEQHNLFVIQANDLVSLAESEEDIAKQVIIYQDASLFLDEADKYGKSETSNDLRAIIQKRLDILQGVTRITVQPTIAGGLDHRIFITRMVVSTNEDLYALDEGTGRVLRLIATRPDYQVDTSFSCGPGNYNSIIVDKLIDIEIISFTNSLNAAIMGIDGNGNLLLCVPGGQSIGIKLKSPELNWGQIKAISFNDYNLYLLDVNERTRDIYKYSSNGLLFDENPSSLFKENIPEDLTEMTDMAVYQDSLFVLNQSGELMKCSLGYSQTNCEQNAGYGIIFSGKDRQNVEKLNGTELVQLQTTQPPDPSLFFLDEQGPAVYHFSLAINMQKQIRADTSRLLIKPEGTMTGFTISTSGIVHFAFGHQLYFGFLP